jgi:5-methylcytosine-specific restriction endonuclease McrA
VPTGIYQRKPLSIETKRRISSANTGKKRSKKTRKRLSEIQKTKTGKIAPNWKGGRSRNEINKSWYKRNHNKKLWYNNRRRARKKEAQGSHTFGDWELLKKQYGYTCPCCGRKEPTVVLTEDHIVPLSKGGSDYIENIQPLCKGCNSQKHTKIKRF